VANNGFAQFGKTISCNVGILASGATATITIVVTKPASDFAHAREIDTTFSAGTRDITIPSNDPDFSNNSVSRKVIVKNP
jgi:hypothetical protein